MKKLLEKMKSVNGWLFEEDIKILIDYASKIKNGTILEIGTAAGKSSLVLALASPTSHVYTIDNQIEWYLRKDHYKKETLYDFQQRQKEYVNNVHKKYGVIDRTHQIIADSKKYKWTWGEIDLLFIDGDHSYSGVKSDYLRFHKFVKKNGYIIFHDYGTFRTIKYQAIEVKKFVDELNIPIIQTKNCAILRME